MNEIEIEYKKILWEGESADFFEQKFSETKNKITDFFEDINVEFKEIIKQTENDFGRVEKINNIG